MEPSEQIRRKAAEAQKWADEATNEYDRSTRLRIAEGWLDLIRKPRRTSALDGRVEARNAGHASPVRSRRQ